MHNPYILRTVQSALLNKAVALLKNPSSGCCCQPSFNTCKHSSIGCVLSFSTLQFLPQCLLSSLLKNQETSTSVLPHNLKTKPSNLEVRTVLKRKVLSKKPKNAFFPSQILKTSMQQSEKSGGTRALWLLENHYIRIPQWTLEECCRFMHLSENSQKKLPGIETVGQAKHAVRQQLELHIKALKDQIALLQSHHAQLLALTNQTSASASRPVGQDEEEQHQKGTISPEISNPSSSASSN